MSAGWLGAERKRALWIAGRNLKKSRSHRSRWPLIQLIGTVLVVLAVEYRLHAQSCDMCYTTVAGGSKAVIHALRGGIIVLLIPPVLLFVGLTVLLFRWKTSASRQSGAAVGAQS